MRSASRGGCPQSASGVHLANEERRDDAGEHEHGEHVDQQRVQPWAPSHGRVECASTAPIIAITMVGNRTG